MGWFHTIFSWLGSNEDVPAGPTREEVQAAANAAPRDVQLLARSGAKIEAIKAYREATGAPLRFAKAVVDWLA
ncbi:MAG: hypothetical protein AAGG01_18170 [Planctomycetota bacterium]